MNASDWIGDEYIQRLTDLWHGRKCVSDHTDRCGYHYETWDNNNKWGEYSSKRYWMGVFLKRVELAQSRGFTMEEMLRYEGMI